jgi:hypothetical protein
VDEQDEADSYAFIYACIHAYVYTNTDTHTYEHASMHTHTHTHTQKQGKIPIECYTTGIEPAWDEQDEADSYAYYDNGTDGVAPSEYDLDPQFRDYGSQNGDSLMYSAVNPMRYVCVCVCMCVCVYVCMYV